jgi:hypothetical protein
MYTDTTFFWNRSPDGLFGIRSKIYYNRISAYNAMSALKQNGWTYVKVNSLSEHSFIVTAIRDITGDLYYWEICGFLDYLKQLRSERMNIK